MWKIEFTRKADKDFSKLTPEIKKIIDKAICSKLSINPDLFLEALTADKAGLYKFRVGDYRLLCHKDGKKLIITVIKIGHRREIYH